MLHYYIHFKVITNDIWKAEKNKLVLCFLIVVHEVFAKAANDFLL